jgi:hypothetical protein
MWLRLVQGSHDEQHSFQVHGLRWQRFGDHLDSQIRNQFAVSNRIRRRPDPGWPASPDGIGRPTPQHKPFRQLPGRRLRGADVRVSCHAPSVRARVCSLWARRSTITQRSPQTAVTAALTQADRSRARRSCRWSRSRVLVTRRKASSYAARASVGRWESSRR